jgi:hypothetical protein
MIDLLTEEKVQHVDTYHMIIKHGIGTGIMLKNPNAPAPVVSIVFTNGRWTDHAMPGVETFADVASWWNASHAINRKIKELQSRYT